MEDRLIIIINLILIILIKEIAFRVWPKIMTVVIDEMLHQKLLEPILIFVVVFIIHLKHLQQLCEYNAVT